MNLVFRRILKLVVMDVKLNFVIGYLQTKNRESTVIAHSGAGYDNKFILQYCLKV